MGRKSKFIRDVARGRKRPRDKKLGEYPTRLALYNFAYRNLYKKLRDAPVVHDD